MSNTISRTFIGTTIHANVVNKDTMQIMVVETYLDGKFEMGEELNKAAKKQIESNNYTFINVIDATTCNETREMSIEDFMKYSHPIETRDVKGYRERPVKDTDTKSKKKN